MKPGGRRPRFQVAPHLVRLTQMKEAVVFSVPYQASVAGNPRQPPYTGNAK